MRKPTTETRRARPALVIALALLLSVVVALPAVAQQPGRRVPEPRIGVQLWTVRDVLYGQGVYPTLQAVAEAGYRNIEPFDLAGVSAAQWREWMDELGLSAPSIHRGIDLLTGDLDQVIADAKTLGVHYVTLNWVSEEWRTPEGIRELAEILDSVGAELRRHGLRLVHHNHDFEFTSMIDGQTMFEYLVENTEKRNVSFQLDLYWATAAGADAVEVIEEHGDRIVTVHVKDMAEDGSFADVGEGILDFAAMFRVQPMRFYFVENDEPDDPIDSITDSYRNLTQLRY